MAGETSPRRATVFSQCLFFQMTVSTQIMELLFDVGSDCWISLVTLETQPEPGCIVEVVMAIDTADALVIHVCEVDGQHGRISNAFLAQHDEHHHNCNEGRAPNYASARGYVKQHRFLAPA
jgi:hypothetical protein